MARLPANSSSLVALANKAPRQKQRGITTISVVVLLAMFGFLAMIAFSVVPVYMENFKVKSHLGKLEEEPNLAKMSDNDIVDRLFRRFQIDNVSSVARQDVSVVRNPTSTDVSLDYEVYAPFMTNIEIVFAFSEKVSISQSQ